MRELPMEVSAYGFSVSTRKFSSVQSGQDTVSVGTLLNGAVTNQASGRAKKKPTTTIARTNRIRVRNLRAVRAAVVLEVVPPERAADRSEEHTSELQSRGHLVCRLLLEKKKNMRKKQMQQTSQIMEIQKRITQS